MTQPTNQYTLLLRALAITGAIVLGACLLDIYSLSDIGGKIAVLMVTACLGAAIMAGAAALSWWVDDDKFG